MTKYLPFAEKCGENRSSRSWDYGVRSWPLKVKKKH